MVGGEEAGMVKDYEWLFTFRATKPREVVKLALLGLPVWKEPADVEKFKGEILSKVPDIIKRYVENLKPTEEVSSKHSRSGMRTVQTRVVGKPYTHIGIRYDKKDIIADVEVKTRVQSSNPAFVPVLIASIPIILKLIKVAIVAFAVVVVASRVVELPKAIAEVPPEAFEKMTVPLAIVAAVVIAIVIGVVMWGR